MELEEKCLSSERTYSGRLLNIYQDSVLLPDSSVATREYVQHAGGCLVIAETSPGVLLFERQFRYPVGQVFIEMPAGKLDPGDTPLGCAQRELREETGYSAVDWSHIGTLHPCIGYSSERIEIFLARDLIPGQQSLDQGEFLEVFEMSLDAAVKAVFQGEITDAKTIACLFWAQRLLAGSHP